MCDFRRFIRSLWFFSINNYHMSNYNYRIISFNVLKYELYISSLHPSLNLHRDPWINLIRSSGNSRASGAASFSTPTTERSLAKSVYFHWLTWVEFLRFQIPTYTYIHIVYIETRSGWLFSSGRDPTRSHRSLIHCRLLCLLVYSV